MHESAANPVPSDQFPSNATSLIGSSSSITSDLDNGYANESFENQNYAEPNVERERSSNMQLDLEELTRKCIELELRLTIEQVLVFVFVMFNTVFKELELRKSCGNISGC